MKKIFILSVFLLLVCTTGCMKYSYNIEIDNKDNINVSEIEAINMNVIETFGGEAAGEIEKSFDENKEEYEKEGYKVEKYKDDKFSGLKHSKQYTVTTYSTYNLPEGFAAKNKQPITVENGIFKNTYTIDLSYDMKKTAKKQSQNSLCSGCNANSDFDDDDDSQDMDNLDKMTKMFGSESGMMPVIDLTIKIPSKAIENNAKEVTAENEYKWNLMSNKPVDIHIKYEKTNWLSIILISVFAILIIAIVVAYKNMSSSKW